MPPVALVSNSGRGLLTTIAMELGSLRMEALVRADGAGVSLLLGFPGVEAPPAATGDFTPKNKLPAMAPRRRGPAQGHGHSTPAGALNASRMPGRLLGAGVAELAG